MLKPQRAGALLLGLAALLLGTPAVRAGDDIDFNRDIRPILSDNCFFCHGPDKKHRKNGLRLDERDNAIKKKAIAPGKPDESRLVDRIFAEDDAIMPPAETNKKLTAAQKDLLKRWVAGGASYADHWAYEPLKRPTVPTEIRNPKYEIRNEIDAFVIAKLQAAKIAPSPEADRGRLLRRLSLDLTGLPPTAEELRAFLADTDPRAYERQVDRLLASPRYGERMAAGWLDVVRFADTVGYHGDQNQNIFPYRDYVIDAFNSNKRFDQFTIEQLAGDLLPNPTVEQRVATGFNRLNMVTREGGAQPKEYLVKYAADRVRTVSAAWLGATTGCAECHDHKYDPITAKDFYSLAAFFADVKQWGVYHDYTYTPNPDLRGFSNDHPFPPEIEVDSPYLARRAERLRDEMLRKLRAAGGKPEDITAWQDEVKKAFDHPDGWNVPKPSAVKARGATATVTDDNAVLLTGKPTKNGEVRIELPAVGTVASVRLELLPHAEHQGGTVRGGKSTTLRLAAAVRRKGQKEVAVPFYHADAEHKQPRYASGEEIIGITGGWVTSPAQANEKQSSVWLLNPPQRLAEGDTLVLTVGSDAVGCVRLGVSPIAELNPWNFRGQALEVSAGGPALGGVLSALHVVSTGQPAEAFAEYKHLYREWLECRGGKARTLVTEACKPAVTRVLPRGNFLDESGEVVQPAVLHFLPQPANPDGRRLTRLDLARWLVSKENPLTARTVVNRLWKQFFGAGLSGVVDDLGAQGEPPSHPELLDWLAVEFRESGWDVKHIVKRMVMSATYRQDSRVRPELKDIDPNNRLLAAQSPRRLEAEFVRDNALFVAGLLNLDAGGPSAFPYQPAGYYAALQFPDRTYTPDADERQYRRGVYTHWQRTFLHPMLANFDAPSREDCTATRVVSNTPQQALTLLNDPTFVEAAHVFAARVLDSGATTDEASLAWAFERVLARTPSAAEKDALLKHLAERLTFYRAHPDEAGRLVRVGLAAPKHADEPRLAAWTAVCRVLLNLHETITRY